MTVDPGKTSLLTLECSPARDMRTFITCIRNLVIITMTRTMERYYRVITVCATADMLQ